MVQKIIISCFNNAAAIVKKNKIQEFVVISNTYQINDIYLGCIQKIFTNINAAFVQLNHYGKSGFIHVSDTKNYKNLYKYNGILASVSLREILLVQITKEPTQTKGPRLTTNIYLTGCYVVLMPFNNTLCVANQIYDKKERTYLRALGILVKPATMGLLFKESATGITEEKLVQDVISLKKQWNFLQKVAISGKCPSLVYKDTDIVRKILRDSYSYNITNIVIDSRNGFKKLFYSLCVYKRVSNLIKTKIQLYPTNGILNDFNIKYTILEVLKPRVQLCSGAYIFIESVEALTVIDVNSGSFDQASSSRESILRTNCLAASEIAYQLQIRNINGIIIIDFIDMLQCNDQLTVLKHLDQMLQLDQAKPQIVQLSELGLVELTRRRKGKSLLEIFANRNMSIFGDITFNHSRDTACMSKNSNLFNVNAVFFKKKFTRSLLLKISGLNLFMLWKISINYFPVINNYLIPVLLYSFLFGKNTVYIVK